ncbi:hypothetical protein JL720_14854 [Aureococcus anophagefferens]|nr:hypothetical protein JL720_14854 [Aureococcus anophagefferens]
MPRSSRSSSTALATCRRSQARCLRNYHLKRETTGKKRGRPKAAGALHQLHQQGLLVPAALAQPGPAQAPAAAPDAAPAAAAPPAAPAALSPRRRRRAPPRSSPLPRARRARARGAAAAPAEAQKDCAPVGDGWWEKKDPASGRCDYVHESTGACQWEKPVAKPPQSPSFH